MPSSTITVPHKLGKAVAVDRLKNILDGAKEQYGDRLSDLQENWTDSGGTFSFKTMGFKIAGALNVTDTDATIVGDYPWAAKPFQKTIETTLRERAERLLA